MSSLMESEAMERLHGDGMDSIDFPSSAVFVTATATVRVDCPHAGLP